MRTRTRKWLTAGAALALLAAGVLTPAGPAGAESNGGTRVMPLGDSITEGTQVPGGWPVAATGSTWSAPSSTGRATSATTTTRVTPAGASTRSTPTSPAG